MDRILRHFARMGGKQMASIFTLHMHDVCMVLHLHDDR